MASYSVFLPPADSAGEQASSLERMRLVRDGFRWPAFLFGPLWFLARRLWLGALGAFGLELLLGLGAGLMGVGGVPATFAGIALGLLFGLEAPSVERWSLTRRGWREADLVVAHARGDAERRAIERLSAAEAGARPAMPAPRRAPAAPATPGVLGLFPEPARP